MNDKILIEIEAKANLLGTHNQSHFDANKKNIISLGEDIRKILNVVSHIRKQQVDQPKTKTEMAYFDFKLFKVKKTSLIITTLGVLMFILTVFCMKQQNDYSLLMSEYYKQSIKTNNMQTEADSMNIVIHNAARKK